MKVSHVALFAAIGLHHPRLTDANNDLVVPVEIVEKIKASRSSFQRNEKEAMYIIQMDDPPVATYQGGTPGIAATMPAKGAKVKTDDTEVIAYRSYLQDKHDAIMHECGVDASQKAYDYSVAFNGFSAMLSKAQVDQMLRIPGVIVTKSEIVTMDTISTPDFLGLTGGGGVWNLDFKGEDVVIGIIDTGIWPENPSFGDSSNGRTGKSNKLSGKASKDTDFESHSDFVGICEVGEQFTADNCNDKLVGARWFGEGFGGAEGIKEQFPEEFLSPRAFEGHGAHVAGTAGGNRGVAVKVDGVDFGYASGIAPRARIAAYKVCWGDAGCTTVDAVAAIDQAVADGVDVINFSLGGTRTNFMNPVEIAFLHAASAGVFVAAAAGNSGPGASTVAHPSPWITTVAAGTHDRLAEASISLRKGKDSVFTGASIQTSGTDDLDMVYSSDVGLSEADDFEVQHCYPGTLDPEKVAGKMVLCDSGFIARTDKSEAVASANGAAMILANMNQDSLNADFHSVPTIHVQVDVGDAIRSYIKEMASPEASFSERVFAVDPTAPMVADFSSRGPNMASPNVLKPDIMAPGVNVLAPYSPVVGGRDFEFLRGTSMSSPHIAGLAAVMKSAHPEWTPMMIKSALMTTSYGTSASPFAEGSGQVNPRAAIDPGLVYDSDFLGWFGFLCGTGYSSPFCDIFEIDPINLNSPNIATGNHVGPIGTKIITRKVTNVGPAGTYQVTIESPPGIDVTVEPGTLELGAGASATFEVSFGTTSTAIFEEYAFGSFTWSDGTHTVHSTLVVRPTMINAADTVTSSGSTGTLSVDVGFGYTGFYEARIKGLAMPTITDGNVVDDPSNNINIALGAGTGFTLHFINIPEGTVLARFSLFDEDTDGDDNLDLFVFGPSGFVGGSGGSTSNEEVSLISPTSGTYIVVVHGLETDGPNANYKLYSWTMTAGGDFPLLVDSSPGSANEGTIGAIKLSWDASTDNSTGRRLYLGVIAHIGPEELELDTTIVEVEG